MVDIVNTSTANITLKKMSDTGSDTPPSEGVPDNDPLCPCEERRKWHRSITYEQIRGRSKPVMSDMLFI